MEIVKILIWPGIVLVLGETALFMVKTPLRDLINRLRDIKADKTGLQLSATAASVQQIETKMPELGLGDSPTPIKETSPTRYAEELTPELGNHLEEVRKFDVMPVVKEQESLIKADIEKLKINPAEVVDILIKQLAVIRLQLRAETVYRTIYGSQILVLRGLNLAGPRSRAELLQYYESTKAKFPNLYNTYSFEQYIAYLIAQGLMTEHAPGVFSITSIGKEFLKWIIEVGVSEDKPF